MGKFLNLLFYFVFAVNIINLCYCQEPKYRLCGDPKCQKIISYATSTKDYNPDTPEKLSFRARETFKVLSKFSDPKVKLWVVQSKNGKIGLAPQEFLREENIQVKKNDLITVPYKNEKENNKQENSRQQLNSSIAVNETETTTTDPLLNNPTTIRTSGTDETITEQSNISPVQDQFVDGTKIPADYNNNSDDGTDSEATIGEDEDSKKLSDTSEIESDGKDDEESKNNAKDIIPKAQVELENDNETIENNTVIEGSKSVDSDLKKQSLPSQSEQNEEQIEEKRLSNTEGNSEAIDSHENEIEQNLEANLDLNIYGSNEESNKDSKNSKVTTAIEENLNKKDSNKNNGKTNSNNILRIPFLRGNIFNGNDGNLHKETEANEILVSKTSQSTNQNIDPKTNKTSEQDKMSMSESESNVTSDSESLQSSSQNTVSKSSKTPEVNKDLQNKTELNTLPDSGTHHSGNLNTNPKLKENPDLAEINYTNKNIANDSVISEQDLEQNNVQINSQESLRLSEKEKKNQEELAHENEKSKDLSKTSSNKDILKVIKTQTNYMETKVAADSNQNKESVTSNEQALHFENDEKQTLNNDIEKNTLHVDDTSKVEPQTLQDTTSSTSDSEIKENISEFERNDGVDLSNHVPTENEDQSNSEIKTVTPEPNLVTDEPESIYRDSSETKINSEENQIYQNDELNQENLDDGNLPNFDQELHKETSEDEISQDTRQSHSQEDKFTTETVKNNWFFANVFETVNNFWSTISTKNDDHKEEEKFDDYLNKLLFPDKNLQNQEETGEKNLLAEDAFCEKVTPNSCPMDKSGQNNIMTPHTHNVNQSPQICSSEKDFFSSLSDKVLEMVDLLACLLITAFTALLFCFGYYCICHSRKESALLSKLNIIERSLLASTKEAAILKHDLFETRNKLISIEDNSFGSNDMVIDLKKELQESEDTRLRLQEQVVSLEKELENAAEAGLELNKIVSELLNNQSGDDSIISSVEELQKQLNEQQNTILQINATLAEKSRENSELQLILTNQAAKFQDEIKDLKEQQEDLKNDRILLQAKIEESQNMFEEEKRKLSEEKDLEVELLQNEISSFKEKHDAVYVKLLASESRVQVLEDCLNGVKNNAKFNIKDLIDAVNIKTEILAIKRERDSLKDRLEGEMDARKLLEDQLKIISEEVSNLKQEYNQQEKEKVEAQTRLEVLSSYFKEKETQLQKDLSLKEAMWLKQQGETSSTVERVRLMQDEIQALKSQNDSLRAEIEAQAATHKAQITTLENRAHETWLTARQSERKLEEARTEATALRRKLTSMAGNVISNETNSQNRLQNVVDGHQNDVNNVPSPVHMDSPGSPLLGGLPPPLPFLPPPPFMAAPHHPFMPMPPPFMPPGEMRPPPLGRLMSPPPPPPHHHDRYSPSIIDDRDRYSPPNGRYSPDNRYNYNTDIISNYDTETDFSPPPSPVVRSGGGGNGGGYNSRERDRGRERNSRGYKPFSPIPPDRNKKSKGSCYSDSEDNFSDW